MQISGTSLKNSLQKGHWQARPLCCAAACFIAPAKMVDSLGAVYDTGALALDDLRINAREPDGFFDEQRPMVLVSVPEGIEVAEAIDAALQRVAYRTCFWLPPNADAGRTALSMYANTESLSRERYLQFLAAADVAVGNSSSLIYEAHAVGTPAVLVGDRQEGRVLPDSVVRVAVDPPAIAAAIVAAMESEVGRTSPFGDGHAAERMVSVLCAL